MLKKIKSKKGVTLVELLVTLVVTSIFFTIVGTIAYTYRNVTNVAIQQAEETAASSMINSAFERLTNLANKDSSLGACYFYVDEEKGDCAFGFEESELFTEPTLQYDNTQSRLKYNVKGDTESEDFSIDVDTSSINTIKIDVKSQHLLTVSVLDEKNIIITQKTFYFVRDLTQAF